MSDSREDALDLLDSRTVRSISDLQDKLRANSITEVIGNALALLKIAVDNATQDMVITMISRDERRLKVDLKGK